MKTCTKCKVEKPFEAFHKGKTRYDGYQSSCIECVRLRRLELKNNPLMQLEKQIRSSVILENKLLQRENKKLCSICKEVFLINDLVCGGFTCKECDSKRTKEYYKKNKEKINEYNKKYMEKNKENRNKYIRKYNKKNKEKKREYHTEYWEKNKEKIKEYQREYREKNKEKWNEYQKEYRLKKKLEMQKNT